MTKSIAQLISEHFARLGSKGGKVKSEAKSKAAKRNGRKVDVSLNK